MRPYLAMHASTNSLTLSLLVTSTDMTVTSAPSACRRFWVWRAASMLRSQPKILAPDRARTRAVAAPLPHSFWSPVWPIPVTVVVECQSDPSWGGRVALLQRTTFPSKPGKVCFSFSWSNSGGAILIEVTEQLLVLGYLGTGLLYTEYLGERWDL